MFASNFFLLNSANVALLMSTISESYSKMEIETHLVDLRNFECTLYSAYYHNSKVFFRYNSDKKRQWLMLKVMKMDKG